MRDLEVELEAEQRRHREAANNARKWERLLKELQVQHEDDRRIIAELQDLLEKTQLKLKAYKRQLEEAVSIESMFNPV